jgi:hypothetical protein
MAQSVNRFVGGGMPRVYSEMKSALDLLDQYNNIHKMSTGSAELDSLIDGLQQGLFYLFYSTPYNQLILDSLLSRMLVGCILPKHGKKHGFESMAVLFNNIGYSTDKNKHQILNPEKIAVISKYTGIEPKIVFKNLYVQTAYNLEHKISTAQEIANKIESNPDIKLLAIRNLTRFPVNDSTNNISNRNEDGSTLKRVLNILYQTCTKNRVAIVATGNCNTTNSGIIPRPVGGTYLKHLANTIVNVKPNMSSNYYSTSNNSTGSSVTYKATMIKHPYQLTPKSTIFYAKRIGRHKNPMLFVFD